MWNWLNDIWESIKGIPGSIIELLGNLLQWLFVPSQDYFSSNFGEIKETLQAKLGYQAYIDIFGTLEDITSNGSTVIELNNYQVGNLNINMNNFINFNNIVKYRDTWYGWVRGFMFVALIIYNINQIYKLIRGTNLADGQKTISNMRGGGKNDN